MNQDAFDKGLKTRREVLGALRRRVDQQRRRLQSLAILTALNRPHELKLHVRGAINDGLTKDDIREVFLQTAIYCGVPAAIDSFRGAKEVFKEMGI